MRKNILFISLMLIVTVSAFGQYDDLEKGKWYTDIRNTDGDVVLSVDMAEIMPFGYAANVDDPRNFDLTVTYKNGNTIVLQNMKDIYLRKGTDPVSAPMAKSDWDLEKTFAFGGASYALRASFATPAIVFSAVHKNGIAYHTNLMDGSYSEDERFENSAISDKLWEVATKDNSRLSLFAGSGWDYGMTYHEIAGVSTPAISIVKVDGGFIQTRASQWPYNNNSNIIPTKIVRNADGGIVMTCLDYNGINHECIFNVW